MTSHWRASILIPGWGQLCQARWSAFRWLAGVAIAAWLFWPSALLLYIACILDAYRYHLAEQLWEQLQAPADESKVQSLRSKVSPPPQASGSKVSSLRSKVSPSSAPRPSTCDLRPPSSAPRPPSSEEASDDG